jgi:hypothetical protein
MIVELLRVPSKTTLEFEPILPEVENLREDFVR